MRHPIVTEDLARIVAAPLPWKELKGKTILISGASGLLPAYMVETLLFLNEQHGWGTTVLALVRNRTKALRRFAHYEERADLQMIVQDVCAPLSLKGEVHYIVHAASQASPRYYGSDPVGTLSANVLGTFNLLQFAREHGTQRVQFFSSSEVYGDKPSRVPTGEEDGAWLDPTQVRACYAESKRMGENLCAAWAHQYGVPTTIVRPFHTYGPGLDLEDGRVFADFIADIVCGRNITMKSDGAATRAFCYLSDAVAGFFAVLLKGESGQPYNVGYEQGELSILELAECLVRLFPEKGLRVVRQNRALDSGSYLPSQNSRSCPDTSKARALGWAPTVSVEEGFRRTIESFL